MRYGFWCLLWCVCLLAAGCREAPEETTYSVRGRFIGPAYQGLALVVDHERIPGYMEPMRMTFKLGDEATLAGLYPGDKIRFDLVVRSDGSFVRRLEVLPETTPLQLAAPPSADTLASSSSDLSVQ